jgi:phage terminase large subunit
MLVVSRKDVNCDAIVEFDPQKRFIKLPIVNYLKLLNIWDTINRPQIALINAVNDPKYRFVCAALARRLGKTYIANIIGQLVTLVPGSNVLIISPNYNLSSISFELQRKLIKHFDLEVARDNLKDKIIELSNGSTIRMGSLGTVDSTVGRSYDLIIFDEAALGEGGEAAFNVALRPTLDKPNAKAIFISTPRGRNNWFSQFWNRGFSDEFPEWISLQADYTENTRMAESDVAEARRSMSKAEFEQEYLASFTVFEGQIYALSEENIIDELPPEVLEGRNCEFIAGCDPGYKDYTSFAVISYCWSTDCFYIIDEYQEREKNTQEHAEQFKELCTKWGIEIVFVDSAAAQFSADLAYLYNISTTKSKKDVLPGIAYVQTLIGQGRLKVMRHCTNSLAMFDQYRWSQKEGLQKERPMHDDFSHMADAIRYALYTYTI